MIKTIVVIGIVVAVALLGWCLCAVADKSDRSNGNK